jgi:hypothetical protein
MYIFVLGCHMRKRQGVGEEDGMPLALGPHWSVRLIVLAHGTTACRPPGQEAMHGCTHSTAGAPVSPPARVHAWGPNTPAVQAYHQPLQLMNE